MRCEILDGSYKIDCSPGNGTRYRLVVSIDGGSICAVAWPDGFWAAGDFGRSISWDWLASNGRKRRLPESDARAIADILQARPWEAL